LSAVGKLRSEVEMTEVAVRSDTAPGEHTGAEALATGEAGSVSFAELVRVHYEWERASRRGRPDDELERAFRQKLDEFQKAEGTLLHAYWSRRRPSAVALTVRSQRTRRWWSLGRWMPARARVEEEVDPRTDPDAIVRLHRATDWLAREAKIADLLHQCDTLGIRVGEVLRGTSERIAMEWIFAVQSHLLGLIERTNGKATDEEINAIEKAQKRELVELERYYARAADRSGRVVYFWGMMVGAFFAALLAAGLAVGLGVTGWFQEPYSNDVQAFFVSYAAGGIGAIVSVMSRMASGDKFELDYEVGRPIVRRLGTFRPFVGAVFGVAVYFLISSGLPQVELPADEEAFFYYGTVAFLAGFFERRTTVIFGSSERILERSLGLTSKDDDDDRRTPDAKGNGEPPSFTEMRQTTIERRVERPDLE
jgi:hypothetical protein